MRTILFYNLQSKRKNAGKGEMLKVHSTIFIGDVKGGDSEESMQALCEAFRREVEKHFKEVRSGDRD